MGLPFALSVLERARCSRDPRFDGRFYFGVRSTGIYCRPICPAAPSARPCQVDYFATAAAAQAAGFRPCLRCRPETAPGTPAWHGTLAVVRRALHLIDEGALDEASVPQFAARLGLGARQLDRLFARHVGVAPIALAQTRRVHFAKRLIDSSNLSMTDIALASGYASVRRFNCAVRDAYGRSPRELRRHATEPHRATRTGEVRLTLAYRPPYDWMALKEFLRRRALPGVEVLDQTSYARVLGNRDGPALIRVRPIPGHDALELRVYNAAAAELFQIANAARRMFDLSADPSRITRDLGTDPRLRTLVKRHPGMRLPGAWEPFECAVRAIIGQQVSVAAGRTFATRLVQRFGEPVCTPVQGLTHVFPTPHALAHGDLSRLGLTDARTRSLHALACAVTNDLITFDTDAATLTTQLTALPGIGEWTAQYVALRALGEPDMLPSADRILCRMASERGRSLSARELLRRAESWRPWRSYATVHLWCAAREMAARGMTEPLRNDHPDSRGADSENA